VVGGLGIDTSGYSIPYLTSWSQDDADIEIVEACAELIDHHATWSCRSSRVSCRRRDPCPWLMIADTIASVE
jgi:hypothetical protein